MAKAELREVLKLAGKPVERGAAWLNNAITLSPILVAIGSLALDRPRLAIPAALAVALCLVLWAAVRLQKQVDDLTNPGDWDREIREKLAAMVLEGDQAWNAASSASQFWEKEWNRPFLITESSPPPPDPPPMPDWTSTLIHWLDEVEVDLRTTPGLGASYADLFRAQEELGPLPHPKAGPLSPGNRTRQDMILVRAKQDRLRGFIEDFKKGQRSAYG